MNTNKNCRWTLRNEEKIKSYFGQPTLERIKKSIDLYFKKGGNLEDDERPGDPYPILGVDDAGHNYGIIVLYVVKKKYDVVTFAFKEFIN